MTLPVVALMTTVSPAGAQIEEAPTGVQTHLGVGYQANPPCARYYTYDANVTFPNNNNPYNVTVAKVPLSGDPHWDENPFGTFAPVDPDLPFPPSEPGCQDGPGYVVDGFLATVLGGGFNCVGAPASYSRNFLTITINITGTPPGGTCPSSPIRYQIAAVNTTPAPPPPLSNPVALCDGPVSRVCVIGPTVTVP